MKQNEINSEDVEVSPEGILGYTAINKIVGSPVIVGNLNLNNCASLIKLPDNLSVSGYLSLANCASLKELPKTMKISGKIYTDLGDFDDLKSAIKAFEKKYG